MAIVRDLAALPHRGATTDQESRAADVLEHYLRQLGASVERQPFVTPKTYISEVWSLVGGLILGLLLLPALSWVALLWIVVCVALALQYFDWRASPVSLFPPRGQAHNVIGRLPPQGQPSKKLILMGHYDSAPISMLYLPSSVKNFRQSLRISIGLMVLAVGVALLTVLHVGQPVVACLRYALVVYFVAQGIMSSIDHVRLGYTNGAADNATGAAVAVATAARLWRTSIPGWQVEVVLTSAEEANMKGALAYYRAHRNDLDPQRTFVFNFDNLGAGTLRVITCTGSLTDVVYDNALVKAALHTAAADPRFQDVKPGVWHTGDFDSIWFCRAGIPSLTLSAQDEQGLIPNLHRPSDTLENVDANLPAHAVDLAEATVRRLAAS
jgi:hypothetical protein